MAAGLGFSSTSDEAAAVFANEIKGKTVLITGVTLGGLGGEVALSIAKHSPKLLILAGRTVSKLQDSETAIKKVAPGIETRVLQLDLGDQAQIRKAAAEVNAYKENIDVLINNAGIMAGPYATTKDGLEAQFGSNHIGHFLFTNLIMPKILASGKGARIVNVSSAGHGGSPMHWDDYDFSGGKTYNKWVAYMQAKTANALFTVGLVERLGSKGLLAYSIHPGSAYTTLFRDLNTEDLQMMGWADKDGKLIDSDRLKWKTLPQCSSTHIVAAFDPSIADQNGSYLQDCKVDNEACKEHAKDKAEAEKLWKLSEELVGQKFEY